MKLIDTWRLILQEELAKQYFKDLVIFLEDERKNRTIFPPEDDVFNAFNMTAFEDIKVVILGQDPYHGRGQGHGLAFSVQDGISYPPSLRNIFKEYSDDLGYEIPKNGNLGNWAKEGVFLINAVLTVHEAEANSHKAKGWEKFTDAVIKLISEKREHVVFILWGKPAQMKSKFINTDKHLILNAPHPSPLSSYRGFFGSKPFSKVNNYLQKHHIKDIDWKLE